MFNLVFERKSEHLAQCIKRLAIMAASNACMRARGEKLADLVQRLRGLSKPIIMLDYRSLPFWQ